MTDFVVLAGGCFWGMQDLLRKQPGIIKTTVGYSGDEQKKASYLWVKTGTTGHAESIKIEFDTRETSIERILDFFFRIHDPTTKNRQGNDIGNQYRSAIFFNSEEQKKVAELMINKVDSSGVWKSPVVTELIKFTEFFNAEVEHQDYLEKHPGGYTCHYVRKLPSFL